MLDLLGQRDWSAATLQNALGVSKANSSQHVTVLKAGESSCEGRNVFFSLAVPEVKKSCSSSKAYFAPKFAMGRDLPSESGNHYLVLTFLFLRACAGLADSAGFCRILPG